ncbi:MAG: DUF6152 family protein [Alphaproteobacteria bacterium]
MTLITRRVLIATALVVAVAPVAWAHHGWGSYDSDTVLTLNGTIKAAIYENPHGMLQFEANGKTWTVVLAPPYRMQNRGLEADMMKPGTTATVVGYPSRNDPVEMRAERITIAGKTTELR